MRRSLDGKVFDPNSFSDLERLSNVFKGKVRAALLFGGRAKGYSMKGDYDIAVYFGRKYDLYELGELAVEIAKVLNVREDQVDILSLDSATSDIVLEALDGKSIYVDDDYTLFELKIRALMELLDLQSGMECKVQ
jgi:predicted nucleotidyltransferase